LRLVQALQLSARRGVERHGGGLSGEATAGLRARALSSAVARNCCCIDLKRYGHLSVGRSGEIRTPDPLLPKQGGL
jgi:hypothetical protein